MVWAGFDISLVFLLLSILLVSACYTLRISPIIGYLIVGIIVGPSCLDMVHDNSRIQFLAELGIVFLLFTIGLEVSLKKLLAMRHVVLKLGALQVASCTIIPAIIAFSLGMSWKGTLIAAAALSLSSTAIVVRQLKEQGELFLAHGQIVLGILVFQDLAAVPFLIIIPLLAEGSMHQLEFALSIQAIKGVIAVGLLMFLGHTLVKPALNSITRLYAKEQFMLVVLFIALGAAWITEYFGLSMALGAFVAGMTLSETKFRHQIEAELLPFRDILLGLFFITIGVRLNVFLILPYWYDLLYLVAAIIVFKTATITFISARYGRLSLVTSMRCGMLLAHGGEFGFALLALAMNYDLIQPYYAQLILSAVIITMFISPLLSKYHYLITDFFKTVEANPSVHQFDTQKLQTEHKDFKDHVIICGFGRVGQGVARLLELEEITYVAIDLDASRVSEAALAGESVFYGDATSESVLSAVGIEKALCVILSFDNSNESAARTLQITRRQNPQCTILVRTRDDANLEFWLENGATTVIPETLETSITLSTHILLLLGRSADVVNKRISDMRRERYQLLMGYFSGGTMPADAPDDTSYSLRAFTLLPSSKLINKSVKEVQDTLGNEHVKVWAIKRKKRQHLHPNGDFMLLEKDVLVIYSDEVTFDKIQYLFLDI